MDVYHESFGWAERDACDQRDYNHLRAQVEAMMEIMRVKPSRRGWADWSGAQTTTTPTGMTKLVAN